jgi:broad specificity phosphatase PhoE
MKIILVRHGEYGGTEAHLSKSGINQIQALGEKIRNHINEEKSIRIFYSPLNRTMESSIIIGDILEVKKIENRRLLILNEGPKENDFQQILDLVHSQIEDMVEVLILVTHMEYTNVFPEYLSKNDFSGINLKCPGVSKGQAIVINYNDQTAFVLS